MASVLQISDLVKSFGSNQVLHGIDLSIESGELVGFMGPNGAGKSTLIKILAGVYDADSGSVRVDGTEATHLGDREDVAFIHQDLGLIEDLTVADNLRLGRPLVRRAGLLIDRRRERKLAERALSSVGASISPDALVSDLSAGEKAMVAVARALDKGGRVIIADEATSTLTPGDSKRLVSALRAAVARGAAVVFVTHKLTETLASCDRIVMLADGRIEIDEPVASVDHQQLVEVLMASDARRMGGARTDYPSPHAAQGPAQSPGVAPGSAVLELDQVSAGHVRSASLTLHAGEVVGVTGLAGSGLHDLGLMVAGFLPVRTGTLRHSRQDTKVALLPPHRETEGGFDDLTVRDNLTISSLGRWQRRSGLLAGLAEKRDAGDLHRQLGVFPTDLELAFGSLSGGNKQKVIFGRLLLGEPDVLVLCEPTRGVDVSTRQRLYQEIRRACSAGAAVLMLTSDIEDLLAVATRVGVITDGIVDSYRDPSDLTVSEWEAAL